MNYEEKHIELDFNKAMQAIAPFIRSDISVDDYCNQMYSGANPFTDLETENHHEIPSHLSVDGSPIVISM